MKTLKGSIVKAISGRDKDLFFVVVGMEDKFILIADGNTRKLEKPKLKSLKHVQLTNTVIETDDLTNKKLRNVLLGFHEGEVTNTHES